MQTLVASVIERPGRFIAGLVQPQTACGNRQRWERPALLAVLLIAVLVRFWGVGTFSLHKPDEDTTALPAVHILQDGTPRFPSGMFYARAIAQSYLIAGSVKIFGQTEWALRLPSVLCGLVVVLLAYFLGRRFLDPCWNMAFVAVVALLPGMIADSQEARMYIFLSASLAAYMLLLFRWERTGRAQGLIGAVLAMLVAIHFQEIALFASLLVLFPGLAQNDMRKLRAGFVALLAIGCGYLVISHWVGSFYPSALPDLPQMPPTGKVPNAGSARLMIPAMAAVVTVGAGLAWLNVRPVRSRLAAVAAGALLVLGALAEGLIYYHLAVLLIVSGLVVARRNGGALRSTVALLLAWSALLAVLQIVVLHQEGVAPARKLLGVMVGVPSIWPYLQVAVYSPIALLIATGELGAGLWSLAQGGKVRDDVLFGLMGVFIPLFVMGFFGWYIPPRYGEFALIPLLLCAMAAAQHSVAPRTKAGPRSASTPSVLVVASVVASLVNPLALARGLNAGRTFPDHRAAARYLRSLHPGPCDIVVAEEALMQTYYLGHIDYWLTGQESAAEYLVRYEGKLVDEYTHTPVILSASAFHALIARPGRGAIYVIGSGESQQDDRRQIRGGEISQLLREPEFESVFVAPDGLTRVWKIAANAMPASAGPN